MSQKLDLNLLPSQAKFRMAKIKTRKIVRKILLGSVIIWTGVAALVLGYWFLTDFQLKLVDRKYKSASADYNSLGDSAVTSIQLKYRAKIVGQLLRSRFEYGETLEKIKGFFPPEVEMSNFELKPQHSFVLAGKCKTNACMSQVEKKIKDIKYFGSEDFKNVELSSLRWNQGVWNFAAEVVIK